MPEIEIKIKNYTLTSQAIEDLAAEFYGKALTPTAENPSVLNIEFKGVDISDQPMFIPDVEGQRGEKVNCAIQADICYNLFSQSLENFKRPKKKTA